MRSWTKGTAPGPVDLEAPHVGYVEQSGGRTDDLVLAENPGRILDRHFPLVEVHQFGLVVDVLVEQRSPLEITAHAPLLPASWTRSAMYGTTGGGLHPRSTATFGVPVRCAGLGRNTEVRLEALANHLPPGGAGERPRTAALIAGTVGPSA